MSRGICKADADGIVRMEEGSNVNSARHWWITHDAYFAITDLCARSHLGFGRCVGGCKVGAPWVCSRYACFVLRTI